MFQIGTILAKYKERKATMQAREVLKRAFTSSTVDETKLNEARQQAVEWLKERNLWILQQGSKKPNWGICKGGKNA
jgi:hypothetical protein